MIGTGEFKSYEDYRCITNTSTKNYQIVSQSIPNEIGLMEYKGYICVALGSYYGNVGDVFKITFEDGNVIKCIKADEKSNKDTYKNAVHKTDGSIVEFVVDTTTLEEGIRLSGSVGYVYKGKITKIERKNL